MSYRFAFLALLTFAVACSTPSPPKPNILVLGNSITHVSPDPSIGWFGNWGMAAPAEDADFAHLVGSDLGLPVTPVNLFIETSPQSAQSEIAAILGLINSKTDVVLEFGDDVPAGGLDAFRVAYTELVAAVRQKVEFNSPLVCTSTWWKNVQTDAVIEQICEDWGGGYAYIGDLATDPANTDLGTITFTNPQVNGHPRKWGHRAIASVVVKGINAQLPPT